MAEPKDLMDVLARLEQDCPETTVASGKRRFRRFPVRADAKLEAIDDDLNESPTILLRNISRGGVGFLVDRFIDPQSMWRIRFIMKGHVVSSQPIMVRFCRLVQNDLYVAGGQFVLEPFVMHMLGISAGDMRAEQLELYSEEDVNCFLGPDDDLRN
ncbi:MAG: hypothetical protein WD294_00850 [Phycisphaeraceae bacterium]